MIKYMRHIFIFIVVWLAAGTICSFAQYKPDRLGEGFEAKTIAMPDDYSGRVVTTLVRSLSSCDTHKAVLYVHGYNDYLGGGKCRYRVDGSFDGRIDNIALL